jgi:prophage regulatory protein
MQMEFIRPQAMPKHTGEAVSTNYLRVSQGLLPPPVKISGRRASGWPALEIEQIQRARMAGWSDEQIKALVQRIIEERANGAPSVTQ